MISEKTVELNVTAELLSWLRYVTGRTHTAIGPSQRAEGRLGYDVSYHGPGVGALIQYKRAYEHNAVLVWHLNRTRRQDQHQRLQHLEARGYPVFYALPHFFTSAQVVAHRRRLLVKTSWFPPSYIQPPGGPTGHHDVSFDTTTGQWSVSSPEPIPLRAPLTIGEVVDAMNRAADAPQSLEDFETLLNEMMVDLDEETARGVPPAGDVGSTLAGQSLLVRDGRR